MFPQSSAGVIAGFLGVLLLLLGFVFIRSDPESQGAEVLRHQNTVLLQELEKTKKTMEESVGKLQGLCEKTQECPPPPPAAACPAPPPCPSAGSGGSTGSSPHDEVMKELVECLRRPPKQFQPLEYCWNEARHKQWLAVLDMLAKHPDGPGEMQKTDWWQAFGLSPTTYECEKNHFRRVGTPTTLYENGTHFDGGKWLCGPLLFGEQEKCVVYSLGSYGDFGFEEEMQIDSDFRCEIHSFDCSGSWTNPSTTFHPWCIGATDEKTATGQFYKLSTIAEKLGHKHVTILKIDIEGFEWQLFDTFDQLPKEFLPRQMMVEFHLQGGDMFRRFSQMLLKLDKIGYRIASKEVNAWCHQCGEFLFVRAEEYDAINAHEIKHKARTGRPPQPPAPGTAKRRVVELPPSDWF